MPIRKRRFAEEQIAHALRQVEIGTPVTAVAGRWGERAGLLPLEEASTMPMAGSSDCFFSYWLSR